MYKIDRRGAGRGSKNRSLGQTSLVCPPPVTALEGGGIHCQKKVITSFLGLKKTFTWLLVDMSHKLIFYVFIFLKSINNDFHQTYYH